MGGGYPRDRDPLSAPFNAVMQAHMDVYRQLVSMGAGVSFVKQQ